MRTRIVLGALALALAASSVTASSVATTVPEHGFVTSSVTLPFDAAQARTLGRDLTGDGHADNALANIFSVLASQELDLTAAWNGDIGSGRIVMLHSLRTRSLATDRRATWQLWYGVPVTTPDLTGTGTFQAGSTHSAVIPAKIVDHHLSTSPATLPVRMDLGAGTFTMSMVAGRAFATCYARCTGGRINGAFRSTTINGVLVPQLVKLLQALVDRDCPVDPAPRQCTDGSAGKTVEAIFDRSNPLDFVITVAEVRNNDLFKALFAPDVDLFKADGTGGRDGRKDSLSFGFGFTAVKATIVH